MRTNAKRMNVTQNNILILELHTPSPLNTRDERKEGASERSKASQCNIVVAKLIRYRCVKLGVVLYVG